MIKIISSILIAGINIVIQMLLPRALSVAEYGYYSYNLNVFTSVVTMCTLSVPSALVSKFSKRSNEIGLVNFYFKFFLAMSLILNMAIILLNVLCTYFLKRLNLSCYYIARCFITGMIVCAMIFAIYIEQKKMYLFCGLWIQEVHKRILGLLQATFYL